MEMVVGGLAAVGAGTFSNPLEVVKIRMQLQGELLARGKYVVHYRNVFHAFFTIGKREGILALQKGLVPALYYQFVMNGTRLGLFDYADKAGLTRNKDGKVSGLKSWGVGASAGAAGAIVASPFYLIKTQLQSKSNVETIAVGHQHEVKNMSSALVQIFRTHGVRGLWRGTSSQVSRMIVSSSIQLVFFQKSLEFVRSKKIFPERRWENAFMASLFSSVFVAIGMAPVDLIATRIYNQGIDSAGKGLVYSSIFDCARKIHHEEGLYGFFKGWTANYFRLGPHLVLLFVFWDQLRYYQESILQPRLRRSS